MTKETWDLAAASGGTTGALTLTKEMEKLTVTATPTFSKVLLPPKRPGLGNVGLRCAVTANHFLVELAERDFHHYDVRVYTYIRFPSLFLRTLFFFHFGIILVVCCLVDYVLCFILAFVCLFLSMYFSLKSGSVCG